MAPALPPTISDTRTRIIQNCLPAGNSDAPSWSVLPERRNWPRFGPTCAAWRQDHSWRWRWPSPAWLIPTIPRHRPLARPPTITMDRPLQDGKSFVVTELANRRQRRTTSSPAKTFAGQTSKSRQVFSVAFRPWAASCVKNPPPVRSPHRTAQSPQIARIPDVLERPKEWPCKGGKNAADRHRTPTRSTRSLP